MIGNVSYGWRAAATLLATLALQDVGAADARLQRLRLAHAPGRWAEALAEANQLLAQRPTGQVLAESLFIKGQCHAKRKEWDEALVSLKSFLVLYPDHTQVAEAAYTAGLVHLARKEPTQAQAIFRDLARLSEERSSAPRGCDSTLNGLCRRGSTAF